MKIAVIGAGLAGLAAAWLLSRRHEVTLFERFESPGFTARNVSIVHDGQPVAVDVPLRVFYAGYYPTLSGNASITRADSDFPPEKSGWSAGVTLNFPLFSGFLTNYQVKEAKENLNVQKANEETLRQGIVLDVQQAYLNLLALEDGVAVAELTVQQSRENYDIATGRYNAGVGSPLDVSSALVGLSNAKTNFIAALANYKIAEAALLKAMGE